MYTVKMKIKISDTTIILGKKGSGKTTLIRYLITELRTSYPITIIDVIGNFTGFQNKKNIRYYLVNPNNSKEIEQLANRIFYKGNTLVVFDEFDTYPYSSMHKDAMYNLFQLGRNRNIGFILSARRTANISKDIIANANHTFIGNTGYLPDIERLQTYYQFSMSDYRSLKTYQFLYIYEGTAQSKVMV